MPTSSRATRTGSKVEVAGGLTYAWDAGSTYVQNPPYFEGITKEPAPIEATSRTPACSGLFLDKITTDHISPAGNIKRGLPRRQVSAGAAGRAVADFNQYGTRRGNHEIMMRGTFANIRIKNQMVKRRTGNVGGRLHDPLSLGRAQMYDLRRGHALREEGVPLVSSPARNTATAPRATGRRRARSCSACAP
jgi:aconitate hydratase